jgi:hypothetical protein
MTSSGSVLIQNKRGQMSEHETSTHSQKEFLNTQLKRIAGAWKSFDTKVNAPIYAQELKACSPSAEKPGSIAASRRRSVITWSLCRASRRCGQYVRTRALAGSSHTLIHASYATTRAGSRRRWTSKLTGKVRARRQALPELEARVDVRDQAPDRQRRLESQICVRVE